MSADAIKSWASLTPHLPRMLTELMAGGKPGVDVDALERVGRELAYRYDPTSRGYTDETTPQLAALLGMSTSKVERCLPLLDRLGLWVVGRRGGSRYRSGSRRHPGPELCAAAHRLGLSLATQSDLFNTAPARRVPDFNTAPARRVPDFNTAPARRVPDFNTALVGETHRAGGGNSPRPCGTPIDTDTKTLRTPAKSSPARDTGSRRERIIDLYADHAVATGKPKPESAQAYWHAAKRTGRKHPDLERYMAEWPNAPESAIAGWMHGDKHSMGYFERAVAT